jgi:multisubunit Na+/H+ antiporter MnhB subunit
MMAALQGALHRSPQLGLSGACVGACGMIVFAIWYLVILIRFQRDLN